MKKELRKISKFKNEDEERKFWAEVDSSEYIDWPKADIITFNAPYLPEDKHEPKSSRLETTGGKTGDEISLKFLKQAFNYLSHDGKIFLLISSQTPMDKIKKFNPKIVARKKIFFEELLILEFC